MKTGTSLKTFIASFAQQLDALDINSLAISGYAKDYLLSLLINKTYYLHIYCYVLDKLLQNISKSKEEIVLVDYGSGNGLLGLFAKHCGFKKVYLNDTNESFIYASKKLSDAMGIYADGFIKGDCNELTLFIKENERPDAVVGTDVIEHIYRLHNFFHCLKKINEKMATVFTTASVTSNPLKNYRLKKLQYADEYKGSNGHHALLDDEFAGMPFVEIRKRIIQSQFIGLNSEQVTALAKATRGMNKEDIVKAGKRFIETRVLPKPPLHATNTCDPITGSWTERLLPIKTYNEIYEKGEFTLTVYNGFYNQWQTGAKGTVLKLVNKTIALLGKQGKVISPFIMLVGK